MTRPSNDDWFISDRPGTSTSASAAAAEFARAILGKPEPPASQQASETPYNQQLREWVAAITTTRDAVWDSNKHPRGGYSENRGWFSPSGGPGGEIPSTKTPNDTRTPAAFDGIPIPAKTGAPQVTGKEISSDDVPTHLLAQGPAAPQTNPNPFGSNVFGQWRDRDQRLFKDPKLFIVAETGQDALANLVYQEIMRQIPPKITSSLYTASVKVYVSSEPLKTSPGAVVDHAGKYFSREGVINIPAKIANGGANPKPATAIRHEIGHAFDHMIQGSTDPRFLAVYRADLAAGMKDRTIAQNLMQPKITTQRLMDQFVPTAEYEEWRAAREAFAEAFALATDDKKRNALGEEPRLGQFGRYFTETSKYVDTLVANWTPPVVVPPRPR